MTLEHDSSPLYQPHIRDEAIGILRRLEPQELWDQVIKPSFRSQGWHMMEENNLDMGWEALYSSEGVGQPWVICVRMEATSKEASPGTILSRLGAIARSRLRRSYSDFRVPLLRLRWILPFSASEDFNQKIGARLNEMFADRVTAWDLGALYWNLIERRQIHTIHPLRIINAKHEAQLHQQRDEGIFSAHWNYRIFRLYMSQEPPSPERALECLKQGREALEDEPLRRLHPYRMLHKVFSTWELLLQSTTDIFRQTCPKLEDRFIDNRIADILDRLLPGHPRLDLLLEDFERMFWQLERLAERYVHTPAGLSTLQMCRLLLRFGFPPSEPGISSRLDRIETELAQEEGSSIDGECSLCTGTAISCLSLARKRESAQAAMTWLTSPKVRACRYCYMQRSSTDVPEDEHALHYAATVLQGFLDFDHEQDSERVRSILGVFFSSDEEDKRHFFLDWIRYSNVDRFEIYRYILAVFSRYYLMGFTLSTLESEMLMRAIRTLVHALYEECENVQRAYLFYPSRTNLTSLSLGLFLGVEEATELARNVAGYLHRRAKTAGKVGGELWDSNVDRNVAHIEGYIEYWETLLAMEERGVNLTGYLPSPTPPFVSNNK
jgi:hypothetical protein